MCRFNWIILVFLCFGLAAGCCAKKSVVVLLPDPDGAVGQLQVSTTAGSQLLSRANQATDVMGPNKAPSPPTVMSDAEIRAAFPEVLAVQPLPPVKFILYFNSNALDLTEESQALLPRIVAAIDERHTNDISVSGHADRTGGKDYNIRLSLQRATIVHDILVSMGVTAGDIHVSSHGEGNPLIKTEDNIAEPRNRRVEVVLR